MKKFVLGLIMVFMCAVTWMASTATTTRTVEKLKTELTDSAFVSQTLKTQPIATLQTYEQFNNPEEVVLYQGRQRYITETDSIFMSLTDRQLIDISYGILKSKRKCTISEIVKEYLDYKHIYDNLPRVQEYGAIKNTPPPLPSSNTQIEDPIVPPNKSDTICVQL